MLSIMRALQLLLPWLAGLSAAAPLVTERTPAATATPPMVFAHYMLISRPPSNNYSTELLAAKAAGIDAFALNYGGWQTNYQQQNSWLTEFYDAAASTGMKCFLSVDTTIAPTLTPAAIVNFTSAFVRHPAQLYVNGAPLLTSFELSPPKTWTWTADVLSKISPTPLLIGGTLSSDPTSLFTRGTAPGASGTFTWLQPHLDAAAQKSLDTATSAAKGSKLWMTAVAPWFFKRFDATDNWANGQDSSILVDRLNHLLSLPVRPDFIELTTWNDWGESSYFGPALKGLPANSDVYWADMDHSAFLSIAAPFIAAFKSGARAVSVAPRDEDVYLFYRVQPAMADDSTMGLPLPESVAALADCTYVAAILSQPAEVVISSGGKTYTATMPAGASVTGVPATWGVQAVSVSRNGGQRVGSGSKTGALQISGSVPRYNGNVVVV